MHSIASSNTTCSARSGAAWLVLLSILSLQIALIVSLPKGVSWDPSYGLLAAQQHLVGTSPSIFRLVQADPADITRLVATPVSFWAPAYQAIPYALRLFTPDWNTALNLTLALVVIVGTIGWLIYFAQIFASLELACWLSCVVALTRYRWTMALTYDGGDQLLWAAAPWVLVLAATAFRLAQRGAWPSASICSALAGAAGASLFAIKYSGIFIAIGAAAVYAIICIKKRYWQMILAAGLGFVGVMGGILLAGFPGGITPAYPETGLNIAESIAIFGMPAMGATDLDRVLRPLMSNAAFSEVATVLFLGILLSAIMICGFAFYFGVRPSRLIDGDRLLAKLAIGAVIADLLLIFLLKIRGAPISPEGRLGRVTGLFLLPILVTGWQTMARDSRMMWRGFAVLSALVFLVLPVTLATLRQVPNLIERFRNASVEADDNGLVNIALTPGSDVQAFYREVASISGNAVVYTIYPQMAFPIARRAIILNAAEEMETPSTLAELRYHGRPAAGVALLLPSAFQSNGKLDAIKSSFVDVAQFVRHELRADPKWALWISSE